MSTVPIRIDQELFESAEAAGAAHDRTAAQQLERWAWLGQELETSFAVEAVERVLNGLGSYDDLAGLEQAVVRSLWRARIAERAAQLRIGGGLRAANGPLVEADADGRVVWRASDDADE